MARCLCHPLSCRVPLSHFGLFGLGTRIFRLGYSLGFSLLVSPLGRQCFDIVVYMFLVLYRPLCYTSVFVLCSVVLA